MELEARITFKSDQPVSFCLTIEFSDDQALAAGFLTVYATADNNLLTTHMYSMKSSFDKTRSRYLEKRISYPSILSDDATDEDDYDNGDLYAHRDVRFYFLDLACDKYFRDILVNSDFDRAVISTYSRIYCKTMLLA